MSDQPELAEDREVRAAYWREREANSRLSIQLHNARARNEAEQAVIDKARAWLATVRRLPGAEGPSHALVVCALADAVDALDAVPGEPEVTR